MSQVLLSIDGVLLDPKRRGVIVDTAIKHLDHRYFVVLFAYR